MMDLSCGKAATAYKIAKRLQEKGYTAYFAGGCVRDFLMQKVPQDYDIATSATPDIVEKLFNKTIAVGKQFGVILVVEGEDQFEVATFRQEGGYQDGRHPTSVSFTGPEEDAKRRDFTVNGLFYDPFDRKVIDYVNGREDIQKGLIKAIGEPYERFEDDKLRLLRTVRFASTLQFEIEPKTWKAVCQCAPKIHAVSAERIRDELIKIFTRSGAGRGFMLLSESGLMKEILPEVEAMKGVEQPKAFHPEGDVFIHTKMMLDKLEKPSVILAFAALFHDVGKPQTFASREGHITFYEHAPHGAKMVQDIMRRLRFSNDEIDCVSMCIDNHMKFGDVRHMRQGKLKCLLARPTFLTELELHRIDCEASHGMLDNYVFLQKKAAEFEKEELKPKPLVNGYDLMDLGIPAGPAMKPLLEELYVLQLEGQFKDKIDALRWVKERHRNKKD